MKEKNKKLFDSVFADGLCSAIFIIGLADSIVNNCCGIRFFGILLFSSSMIYSTITALLTKIFKKSFRY